MDNGASSYRRFRDDGDESGLVEIIRDYRNGNIHKVFTALTSTPEHKKQLGRKIPKILSH